MSQVETVARAMFEAEQDNTPISQQMNRILYGCELVIWEMLTTGDNQKMRAQGEKYRRLARVAIKALRVPSQAMLDCVCTADPHETIYRDDNIRGLFTVMMDVAADESPAT